MIQLSAALQVQSSLVYGAIRSGADFSTDCTLMSSYKSSKVLSLH